MWWATLYVLKEQNLFKKKKTWCIFCFVFKSLFFFPSSAKLYWITSYSIFIANVLKSSIQISQTYLFEYLRSSNLLALPWASPEYASWHNFPTFFSRPFPSNYINTSVKHLMAISTPWGQILLRVSEWWGKTHRRSSKLLQFRYQGTNDLGVCDKLKSLSLEALQSVVPNFGNFQGDIWVLWVVLSSLFSSVLCS